jgi:ferredoxin-NADP reductase
MVTPSHEFQLPFLRKVQVAKDTYSFYFQKTEPLEYLAGQYIRMTLPLTQEDPRGNKRPFSLCSSPLDSEIMITTKVIPAPSIFKQKLSSLVPGELVTFFGPIGGFVLPEPVGQPVVLLAGGIGITPFHSMLTFAGATAYPRALTLLVSFTTVEEAAFYEQLNTIHEKNSSLRAVYTISHPETSTTPWHGETGRIDSELLQKYVANVTEASFMLCGPQGMVEAMEAMVLEMGINPEQIKKENFTGY